MPLQILCNKKGESKIIIVCDYCGKNIKSADDGNCQWPFDEGPHTPCFTHKECCHSFDELHPGWGAHDLDTWLVYLTNSLKVDWKKANGKANMLSRINSS